MTINNLRVTSGNTHTVYFDRTVPRNQTGTIFGEIDGVCNFVDGPFPYTVDEKEQKVWSVSDWTGKERCTPKKPGRYILTTCWVFPFLSIYEKVICRDVEFTHYKVK